MEPELGLLVDIVYSKDLAGSEGRTISDGCVPGQEEGGPLSA